MDYTLAQLAAQVTGEVRGDGERRIAGVATLQNAGPAHISFLSNPRYRKYLQQTAAGAVIVSPEDAAECPIDALVVRNPYVAFARIAALLNPAEPMASGVHPSAVVAPGCQIDLSAAIGAYCTIGAGVHIGAGVQIGTHCAIGRDCVIGADSRLMPHVTIYHGVRIGRRALLHSGAVIGSDGFGFANDAGVWVKVPQLGGVLIGDDVEIGSNTVVDRGALEDTVLEDGVKLDNHIQISHNVRIGAHTVMAGSSGVAGSSRVGRHCAIGGMAGVAGHLEICDNVQITGMTLVSKSITRPGVYSGAFTAEPNAQWNEMVARVRRLESYVRRLKDLEQQVNDKKV